MLIWDYTLYIYLALEAAKVHNENQDVGQLRKRKMRHKYFCFLLMMALALTLFLSACGSATAVPTSTSTNAVTNTPQPTATKPSTLTITPSPTVTPDLAATQQYKDFFSLVQKYYDAGQVSTTEGEYVKLDNYEHALANKLSYEWTETGVTAKNFIVQADFEWTNAVNTINISGCGFVFRSQPNGDHYLIILDAASGVKLASSTDRGTHSMGSPQNGDQKISDFGSAPYQANLTLIVNEFKTYIYLNDIYQGEYQLLDYRITESGSLANAVLSGTSEGYGTRCKMTNVRAWIIDQ